MKNINHKKFSVLIAMLVIFALAFSACASPNVESQDDDPDTGPVEYEICPDEDAGEAGSPTAQMLYAYEYIQSAIQDLTIGIFDEPDGNFEIEFANIVDTRINSFERVAEFDNVLHGTVEMWRLDFEVQTTDLETELVRWGTFSPDEDGWIGQRTAWNEANVLLVFEREDVAPEDFRYCGVYNHPTLIFLGYVPAWMDRDNTKDEDHLEDILHEYLEYINEYMF